MSAKLDDVFAKQTEELNSLNLDTGVLSIAVQIRFLHDDFDELDEPQRLPMLEAKAELFAGFFSLLHGKFMQQVLAELSVTVFAVELKPDQLLDPETMLPSLGGWWRS